MPLSGCRILLVEDDFLIGESVAAIVQEAGGSTIGPFATMIEALGCLSDLEAIDGAVLDVGLEGEFSYPLAEALRTTRIPFLFLTGRSKQELPADFASATHLQKPFNASSLVKALVDCGVTAQN
jgi:DNA-binding LytR/AlgR family response regulator